MSYSNTSKLFVVGALCLLAFAAGPAHAHARLRGEAPQATLAARKLGGQGKGATCSFTSDCAEHLHCEVAGAAWRQLLLMQGKCVEDKPQHHPKAHPYDPHASAWCLDEQPYDARGHPVEGAYCLDGVVRSSSR